MHEKSYRLFDFWYENFPAVRVLGNEMVDWKLYCATRVILANASIRRCKCCSIRTRKRDELVTDYFFADNRRLS